MSTSTPDRTLHLNVNLSGASGHPSAFIDADYYKHVARVAEEALFDCVFLANISSLRDGVPGQGLDTIVNLAVMAEATERIGLVGTISTTLNHPYSIARAFASLEHVSRGRVGWNVVTTRNKPEGLNYGFDPLPGREERYARAAESIEVVLALWESWQDGAIVDEPGAKPHFETARMVPINHVGEFYSVAGPLQLPSYRSTRPLITQAGGSDAGNEVGARYADAVFTSQLFIENAQEEYAKVKSLAARYGRDPETVAVLPGLNPVIGSTETEAKDLAEADVARLLPEFAKWTGVDAGLLAPDEPFPLDLLPETDPVYGSTGFDKSVRLYLERNAHRPVRDLLADSPAAGRGGSHRTVIGTPEQIADDIEEWFTSRAADGFIMGLGALPEGLEVFAEHVVPLLQKKGIFRTEYAETSLRERFGAR